MCDVRRVYFTGFSAKDPSDGSVSVWFKESQDGTHALLPWEEYEGLRAEFAEKQRLLAKAGRDHITLQTNFAAELAKRDAVIEAAERTISGEYADDTYFRNALRALDNERETCNKLQETAEVSDV